MIGQEFNNQPRVFISYSWDNEQHKAWILKLSNQLCTDGVNVILDRYELRAGRSITHFVDNAIDNADKILIVFTPNYKLKALNRSHGAGYEYSIINNALYNDIKKSDRIIPILRSAKTSDSIPDYMQQFIHLDFTDDTAYPTKYLELLREIYDELAIKKPVIGQKPSFEQLRQLPSKKSSTTVKQSVFLKIAGLKFDDILISHIDLSDKPWTAALKTQAIERYNSSKKVVAPLIISASLLILNLTLFGLGVAFIIENFKQITESKFYDLIGGLVVTLWLGILYSNYHKVTDNLRHFRKEKEEYKKFVEIFKEKNRFFRNKSLKESAVSPM